jgi:glycosyltransferase involved in cell wall biosynthesis
MSSQIKISVIIPCYNALGTINQCISSIYNQTYKVNQIIVIDDGSSDDSLIKLEILKKNCPENIDFVIFRQQNSGPSVARNKGIEYSTGEWIAFLDADDFWDSAKLETQVNFVKENQEIVLFGMNNTIQNDFQIVSFYDLMKKNYFQTSSVLVKSEVMKLVQFPMYQKYSEDYRSWLTIAKFYKTAIIKGNLVFQVNPKSFFGESGLSSKLWEMEKGELSNFLYIRKKGFITNFTWIKYSMYSLLKFFRRKFIVTIRNQ